MAEQIPTPEEYRLLEKTLIEKVLERAATDPQWKQLLLEDPEAAMQEAAFPEVYMLTEINERIRVMPTEEAEAVGHVCPQRAYTPSQPFSLYLTHPVLETGSDASTPQ